MKHRLGLLLALSLVVALFAFSSPTTAQTPQAEPGWKGRPHAKAGAYSWVWLFQPSDTYTIAVVRGKNQRTALRALGVVKQKLGPMSADEAEAQALVIDETGFTARSIVQVQRRGGSVFVYQPYGYRPSSRLRQLSSEGLVALFRTTGDRDSFVKVARNSELLRSFRVHKKPPKHGALPQEKGLRFGARDTNGFATAWAFTERVSLIHISEKWFQGDHPTFLLKGGGF